MPTTQVKNLIYRAALPLLAPSPKGRMTVQCQGHPLGDEAGYLRLMARHRVLGASLLLKDGGSQASVHVSVGAPINHAAGEDTLYRVASITKMATALTVLRLCEAGAFALEDPVAALLPGGSKESALAGVTLEQLLCHTSGLRDVPAYQAALEDNADYHRVLRSQGVRGSRPGERFAYCNLGFGLVGCILEQATGRSVAQVMAEQLFRPLGMEATLDASALDPGRIMPIRRVLARRASPEVRVTALGARPLDQPDPERHFGHTAGAMYTGAASLSRMMALIAQGGAVDGRQLLRSESIRQMTAEHATYGAVSPGMRYGLGLVLLEDPALPGCQLVGHQGFAYGCVDGAFADMRSGRQVIFLNGGASEARDGRLGLVIRDVLRWGLGKEMSAWT